jgi:hypothetical protein
MTCDLVQSKKVSERFRLQQQLKLAIEFINKQFLPTILCPFISVWGDSFQGALKSLDQFYDVLEAFEAQVPVDFRCGIGIGEITTNFSANVLEMDGPAFHRSRTALDFAKKNQYPVWVQSGNHVFDGLVNTIVMLLYALKSSWTTQQTQIIHLRRTGMTYAEIGATRGITKQAVYKSLKASKWTEASLAISTLNELVQMSFEQMEVRV